MGKSKTAAAAPVEPAAKPAVTSEAPAAPVASKGKVSKQFRVYNERANIVAQVADEDEARALATEHKGHYSEVK